MEKIKSFFTWLLTIVGVIYLVRLFSKDTDVDLGDSDMLDKIDELEGKLEDIETSDPDIDDILEEWNK